jgi:hypothetical protein
LDKYNGHAPLAAEDERIGGVDGSPTNEFTGGTYREEAQHLIDVQTAALFAYVWQEVIENWGNRLPVVQGSDHSLTVGSGKTAVEFTVEAITDVPADADPALTFPTGQARCIVRVAGATIDEWVLSRADQGLTGPAYHWIRAETGLPLTADDVRGVVGG